MMQIVTYEQIERTAWEQLVRTSKTGTWFQSGEAYDFFAAQPELFHPFVYGLINGPSRLRAVCVGYVTKETNPIKQYFTRRAIILGGPTIADDASLEEVELLMNGVKELTNERINEAPIYIETRNFNDYSSWREAFERAGFAYKPHLNFHVNPIESRLSENRRRQIKKSDAICELAQNETEIKEWYRVLERLYNTKVKTPLWPVSFFLEAYRRGIGKFLLVKHNNDVIGGTMVVALTNERGESCVYEWFECGLNVEYKEQYPSVMATYSGIRYAQEHGCSRYDMMGAGEPGVPYGVRDFKSEFGGEMVEHGRFLHICNPSLYRLGSFIVERKKSKVESK